MEQNCKVRNWVDGPPTEEMIRARDKSMDSLGVGGGRWDADHPDALARAAFETGWDEALSWVPDQSEFVRSHERLKAMSIEIAYWRDAWTKAHNATGHDGKGAFYPVLPLNLMAATDATGVAIQALSQTPTATNSEGAAR